MKNILFAILLNLLIVANTSASEVAIGSTERNKETYLTIGNATYKNPKNSFMGYHHYGFGSGQLELGRTWGIDATNQGGVILKESYGLFGGLELMSGEIKVGSQPNQYYSYEPGLDLGFHIGPVIIYGKAGYAVNNFYKDGDLYPNYDNLRGVGTYLTIASYLDVGFNYSQFAAQERRRASIMLFNTVVLMYQDDPLNKAYTIIIDLN